MEGGTGAKGGIGAGEINTKGRIGRRKGMTQKTIDTA